MALEFDVTIEIPKGTRNKYVYDPARGRIRLDRTLFTATQYPGDYGFVDGTFGADVDALDALVLVEEPTFPGCVIRCRTVAVFRISDEHGPTPKVLCVPVADLRLDRLQDLDDVEAFLRLEIRHFFEIYKALEPGKRVILEGDGWDDRAAAEAEVRRAFERVGAPIPAPRTPESSTAFRRSEDEVGQPVDLVEGGDGGVEDQLVDADVGEGGDRVRDAARGSQR